MNYISPPEQEVTVNEPTVVNFTDLKRDYCVYGTVTDTNGAPQSNINITVFQLNSSGEVYKESWLNSTTCGLDGRYMVSAKCWDSFENQVSSGTVRLVVDTQDYERYETGSIDVAQGTAVLQNITLTPVTTLGSITATVTDTSGSPISWAVVTISQGDTISQLGVDDSGQVAFAHLANGTWSVSAAAEGYVTSASSTEVNNDAKSVALTLIGLGRSVTLEGYVRDEGGMPIEQAEVWFEVQSLSDYRWSAYTNADGHYYLELTYGSGLVGKLGARKMNYREYSGDSLEITDAAMQTVSDITLGRYTGRITINVTFPDGTPVPDLYVEATSDKCSYSKLVTNAQGRVVIDYCDPSPWSIYVWDYRVWDSETEALIKDYRCYDWYAGSLPMGEGQERVINATVIPYAVPVRFQGNVVDLHQAPFTSATVTLYGYNEESMDSWLCWQEMPGQFDKMIWYSFNQYRVTASAPGYESISVDFTPQQVPATGLVLTMRPTLITNAVSGYILDYLDIPLVGVSVVALTGGQSQMTAITDGTGHYSLDLTTGSYNISVSPAGYIPQTAGAIASPGSTYTLSFQLFMENAAYGRILGYYENGIAGANVQLQQGGLVKTSVVSIANGRFMTGSVAAGDYTLTVSAPGYITYSADPLTIIDGAATYQYVGLQSAAICSIYGYVTDSVSGQPITGATVQLQLYGEVQLQIYDEGGGTGEAPTTTTDASGYYIFTDLYPNYYALLFLADGYVDAYSFTTLGVGENQREDKALMAAVPGSISSFISCWAGTISGATVTLDGLTSVASTDIGTYGFSMVSEGGHTITVERDGVTASTWIYLNNGENQTGVNISLPVQILATDPSGGFINNVVDIGVRVFGQRPGAGIEMYVVRNNAVLVDGATSIENDWIVFTPATPLAPDCKYSTNVSIPNSSVPGVLNYWFNFWFYPRTDNPPVITAVAPNAGVTVRNPSIVYISASASIDIGNGINEAASGLSVDGAPISTDITGGWGVWHLSAAYGPLSHGQHTLRAVVMDENGRYDERIWQIFYSDNQQPTITGLTCDLVFSPNSDGVADAMNIRAQVNEPIYNAVMYMTSYSYPVTVYNVSPVGLGNFDAEINGTWNGRLHSGGLWYNLPRGGYWLIWPYDFSVDDGPITFVLTGTAGDGTSFNMADGSTFVDTHGPALSFDLADAFKPGTLTKTGTISDASAIGNLTIDVPGGTATVVRSGNSLTATITYANTGIYSFTCWATDIVGNTGGNGQTLYIDSGSPIITILTPQTGAEVRPAQPLAFSATDDICGFDLGASPATVQMMLDGAPLVGSIQYGATNKQANGQYLPKYLKDGQHTLEVTATDRAGNQAHESINFSSVTKLPEIYEKNISMRVNPTDQTVYVETDIQENSDRGWAEFSLNIDGSAATTTPSYTPNIGAPYAGVLVLNITKAFDLGPHSIQVTVTDGLGLTAGLSTGFYYDKTVGVPQNYAGSNMYVYTVSPYSGNYYHDVHMRPGTEFKPGGQAVYGYCRIDPPPETFYDSSLPMGNQEAWTVATSNPVDASGTTALSLWMTGISDAHVCRWGWGEAIYIIFDDGLRSAPIDPLNFNLTQFNLLYAHHEAPWVNDAGYINNWKDVAVGADGRTWYRYEVPVPTGIDLTHVRVKIVWRCTNWCSWGDDKYNQISSKVDSIEFCNPLVTSTYPPNGAIEVPLSLNVTATFRLPVDPTSLTNDTFYLADKAGQKVGVTRP